MAGRWRKLTLQRIAGVRIDISTRVPEPTCRFRKEGDNAMKYLGWIVAFLLLIACVINQVTISNYKASIADWKKTTAIW